MSMIDEAREISMKERVQRMSEPPPEDLWGFEEVRTWDFWKAALAEFIGMTFFLCKWLETDGSRIRDFADINIAMIIHTQLHNAFTMGTFPLLVTPIALGFGFSIAILVAAVAPVSGGHLNPAVSWALVTVRKASVMKALAYTLAQCAGATLGAGLVRMGLGEALKDMEVATPDWITDSNKYDAYAVFGGGINSTRHIGAAFIGEFVMTALLLFTVMAITDHRAATGHVHLPTLGPVLVGLAVLVAHLALTGLTGTSINPARSTGPILIGSDIEITINNKGDTDSCWSQIWLWWLAPILGGIAGAQIYWWGVYERNPATQTPAVSANPLSTD